MEALVNARISRFVSHDWIELASTNRVLIPDAPIRPDKKV